MSTLNTGHYWYHNGENQAIRQRLGHAELPQFVGNVDDEAPYGAKLNDNRAQVIAFGGVIPIDAVGMRIPGHRIADFFSFSLDQVFELGFHGATALPAGDITVCSGDINAAVDPRKVAL